MRDIRLMIRQTNYEDTSDNFNSLNFIKISLARYSTCGRKGDSFWEIPPVHVCHFIVRTNKYINEILVYQQIILHSLKNYIHV